MTGKKIPTSLRPATASDVIEGAIIWYLDGDCGPFRAEVDEVLRPSDPWKAYCAKDGCRYGLEGAFVECDEPDDRYRRDLNRACDLVMQAGLTTGHADTFPDLMAEVLRGVDELRAALK